MPVVHTKLNDFEIKPKIKNPDPPPSKIRWGDFIPNYRPLCLLCAKRNSGKTTVWCESVENTADADTIIWIFSPTAEGDPTVNHMVDTMRERGNIVNIFSSLKVGKDDALYNIVDELCKDMKKKKEKKEKAVIPVKELTVFDKRRELLANPKEDRLKLQIAEEKIKKKKKKKLMAPTHIFVIDDLSSHLRYSLGIHELCKNGRHIHAAIYISFQYKNDLPPSCWTQCQFFFCFRHLDHEKLQDIYKELGLRGITFEQFLEIYYDATYEPENPTPEEEAKRPFLLINVEKSTFRKNFSEQLEWKN